MKIKSLNNKGQSAWFDIVIIFMCITIFTTIIWTFSMNGKAASTQMKRSRQDFTNSLLISMLYTTLDADNDKYRGKSISDVIGMYFANPQKVKEKFVIESLNKSKIHEYLKNKGSNVDSEIEWFLYGETKETKLCIHGKGTGDSISGCEKEREKSYDINSACVELVYPKDNKYEKVSIYLMIKWSK
ncbi:MAG: hypothetical protein U9Q22_06125 [Candidatus Altiarchaeota archaeon]|nr:hypothetical protein [Candidatus Altiarchaeota archaeon]